MSYFCAKCSTEISSSIIQGKVARGDSCPKCGRDLRTCLNCKHYDTSAYNQCHEPQADRVVDKERANFCDYFTYKDGKGAGAAIVKDHKKALDDLFKK